MKFYDCSLCEFHRLVKPGQIEASLTMSPLPLTALSLSVRRFAYILSFRRATVAEEGRLVG